jgi:glutamate synthase domain-containing protein 2
VLPGPKVTAEIAAARGVPIQVDCISPARHGAFSTPIEMLSFIDRLRELSGGKPTGFKLCIGHPWEWFAICKAMLETGVTPDFIVIDGAEGGTGAAPLEFTDHVGTPLQEGLLLVHNTLSGLNLRSRVRLGAAGKVVSAFDIARMMALGADWCNAARGFMFALGCIQAQHCHTGACPTGVTTQDPLRQRALVVGDKIERVFHFHQNTLEALKELVQAAALEHPNQIRATHIVRRGNDREVRLLANSLFFVQPGELLAAMNGQVRPAGRIRCTSCTGRARRPAASPPPADSRQARPRWVHPAAPPRVRAWPALEGWCVPGSAQQSHTGRRRCSDTPT